MGMQEKYTSCSGLYMCGILQIIDYMNKRNNIINDVFKDFFIDSVDTKTTWYQVQKVFLLHDLSAITPTGKTPSKDIRQADASLTPFNINRSPGAVKKMYETATNLNLIKTGIDLEFDVVTKAVDRPRMEANFNKWNALISAFEVIYLIEDNTNLILNTICHMKYNTGEKTMSPAQIQYFSENNMNGYLIDWKKDRDNSYGTDSCYPLLYVNWQTIDDILDDTGLQTILEENWEDIWYLTPPTIDFEGYETANFSISFPAGEQTSETHGIISSNKGNAIRGSLNISSISSDYPIALKTSAELSEALPSPWTLDTLSVSENLNYNTFIPVLIEMTGDPDTDSPAITVNIELEYLKISVT